MSLLTNKRFIQAVGFAGCATLGAAFLVSALEPTPVRVVAAPPPANVDTLTTLLDEVRRTWLPEARVRLAQRCAEHAEEIESPLVWVLRQDAHPNLDEAIWLAGALGLESSFEPLLALTTRGLPARRALAVHAIEAARGCRDYELEEWLADGEVATQRAALDVLAARIANERPVVTEGVCDLVVDLLEHDSEDVRVAARAAIPSELPEESRDRLEGQAQITNGEDATAILSALGKAGTDGRLATTILGERAQDPDPEIAEAALEGLRALGRTGMDQVEIVSALACDRTRERRVRCAALRCLEATGTTEPARLGALIDNPEPELTVPLSRCLISIGDARGLGHLVDLIEQGPEAWPDGGGLEAIARARRLLCQATGLSPTSEVPAFRSWLDANPEIAPLALPAPPAF